MQVLAKERGVGSLGVGVPGDCYPLDMASGD